MFKMRILLEYGYDVSQHIYAEVAQEQKKEEEKAPPRPNTVTNEPPNLEDHEGNTEVTRPIVST